MKIIKVSFIKKNNKFTTLSSLKDENDDFDIIGILLNCIDTIEKIKEFKRLLFIHGKTYDHDILNVNIDNKAVTISVVSGDSIKLPKKFIYELVNDWEKSLKNKKEFEKEYYL